MKRSRIRRKAATPKRWIDEEARRAYMDSHKQDELERHLCGPLWERVLATSDMMQLDPHHIWHTGNVRHDVPQNLLAITRRSHDYVHFIEPRCQVAVMYAKLTGKTRTARDRIRESWNRLYQRDAIGWVQSLRDGGKVPDYYLDAANAVLEMF